MNITGYIWREDVIDKLTWKHQVQVGEVVGLFDNKPCIERLERGYRPGEDLYVALGQTDFDCQRCSLLAFCSLNHHAADSSQVGAVERQNYGRTTLRLRHLDGPDCPICPLWASR